MGSRRRRTIVFLSVALNLSLAVLLTVRWRASSTTNGAGRVVYVVDGDTLVIDNERMRMAEIDAPEFKRPGGKQATAWLRAEVMDRPIWYRWSERGYYGRPLVTLWTEENSVGSWTKSVNYRMMRAGHATPYVPSRRR